MVNKKNVLFIGALVMFVNIAILAVAIYYGYKSGLPFLNIIHSLSKVINLKFYLGNFILILLLSVTINLKIIFKFYIPLIILALVMGFLNVILIPQNIIAIFNTIFFAFYLVFLYFNKKALKAEKAEIQ